MAVSTVSAWLIGHAEPFSYSGTEKCPQAQLASIRFPIHLITGTAMELPSAL